MKIILISLLTVYFSLDVFSAENTSYSAKLKYYISKIEENKEPIYKMIAIYDSVIKLYEKQNNIDDKVKYMFDKAKLLANNGEYAMSFNVYSEVLNVINTNEYTSDYYVDRKKYCMLLMGKLTINLSIYDESTAYFFDLLEYNKDSDINYTVNAYSMLGLIFLNMNKIQTGEEYLSKANQIMKTIDTLNSYSMFTFYSSYAGLFYFKQEYDTAIKYLSKAEECSKRIGDKQYMGHIYHNLAIIYQELREYDIAEDYFMRLLQLTSGEELSYIHALASQNLAFLYTLRNKNDLALKYYNKALDVSTRIRAIKIKGSVLVEMSDIFFENGEYKKSREYLAQGQRLRDSIFNVQNMGRITILTNRYKTQNEKIEKELMEKTLLALELNNKNKTIILAILAVMFAIFIAVVIICVRRLILQRQANELLNKTIIELKRRVESDMEDSRHQLKTSLEDKDRELNSTALCLIKANELLCNLKSEVDNLSTINVDSNGKKIIKEISSMLNNYNVEQGWTEFKLYFGHVNQSFFTSLTERHPDITQSEQRLCALIVLNTSAKEIATINNRSVRTVETLIYMIRKKLNIPTEMKTVNYLKQFMKQG